MILSISLIKLFANVDDYDYDTKRPLAPNIPARDLTQIPSRNI